MDTNLWK